MSAATVTLGGSSAASAAGINPFQSRIALWLELTGRTERRESEAMEWGRRLEWPILDGLRARGYVVRGADALTDGHPWFVDGLTDPARPWLVGHPDGIVELDGHDALLEVKTAGAFAGKWSDVAPLHYVAQCQIYMHLTGLHRALLACLVGGQKLELREVARDEHALGLLLAAMEQFVGYVERDEPPPPDGSDSATEALLAMYPHAESGRVYRLTPEEWKACKELRERKKQATAIDRQVTELENVLKAAMGDCETAISPHDAPAIRWSNVKRSALDTTRLKSERPDLAASYTHTTESRRFTVA